MKDLLWDFQLTFFLCFLTEVRGITNRKTVIEGYENVQAALLDYTLTCYPSVTVSCTKVMLKRHFNFSWFHRINLASCSVLFQKSTQLPRVVKSICIWSTVLEAHHRRRYLWKCFMRNENNLTLRNTKLVSTFPIHRHQQKTNKHWTWISMPAQVSQISVCWTVWKLVSIFLCF